MSALETWRRWWNKSLTRRKPVRLLNGMPEAGGVETLECRVVLAATTLGSVFDVPSRTVGEQVYDSVGASSDGSFTVVFSDNGLDSSGWGVYARRFSANGVPLGNQFRINSTTSGDQYNPSIATNSSGISLVAFRNEYFAGGYTYPTRLDFQFVNANGTLLGSNVNLIPEDYYEIDPGAGLDTGTWDYSGYPWTFVDNTDQFWVVVPISQNGGGDGFYGHEFQFFRVSTDGTFTKQFETRLINEINFDSSVSYPLRVTMGDDGTFYLAFDIEHNEAVPDVGQQFTSQLIVRRFSSSTGEQIGTDVLVHNSTWYDDYDRYEHTEPVVVPEADGKFSVLYYNRFGDLVSQHFSAAGTPQGSQYTLIGRDNLNPGYIKAQYAVETLSNDNWLVVWSVPYAFGTDYAYAQEFTPAGAPVGAAVEIGEGYYLGALHVAEQGNDQFVVSWQDGGGNSGYGDVSARRITANVAVPGVTVTPVTELQTTEAGGTASFQVVLDTAPTSNVVIPLSVQYDSVASLSAAQLIFTPQNWNQPQTVTVTGLDDHYAFGDTLYDVDIGPAFSNDTGYLNLVIPSLSFVNYDDDVVGVTVSPLSGLEVGENGSTATFSVFLNTEPFDDVTIYVSSNDVTEGTVNKSALVFTPLNWSVPQVVTVTGVNDDLTDGDVLFQVILSNTSSSDYDYAGLNVPDVVVTNHDNDVPGIIVTPTTTLTTSEAGQSGSFNVRLQTAPTSDVTIQLNVDDATEGSANKTTLTFTSANWNTPQLVTVTGQNDDIDDGDVTYHMVFTSVTSSDASYNNLTIPNLTLVNTDNDTAGFAVTPTNGLQTTEAGGTASFTVVLTSKPAADVVIGVSSSLPTEGLPSVASLTFTPENWNQSQTVVVTGQDDGVADGITPYQIVLAAAVSSDETYNGLNPPDVSLTNRQPNVPPTLQLFGSQALFGKKSAPVSVVTTAAVTDDLPNLAGGRLRISITSGFNSFDELSFSSSVNGLSLGTLSHNQGDYTIELNANATPAALQQLLESVRFSTAKKGLKSPSRTIEFQLTDSDGGLSSVVERTVQVSKKKLK